MIIDILKIIVIIGIIIFAILGITNLFIDNQWLDNTIKSIFFMIGWLVVLIIIVLIVVNIILFIAFMGQTLLEAITKLRRRVRKLWINNIYHVK